MNLPQLPFVNQAAAPKKAQEVKGQCPYCRVELWYDPSAGSVMCGYCDRTISVAELQATPASAAPAPAAFGGVSPIAAAPMPSFDNADAALVYLENFFETYEWSDFHARTEYTMYEIEELVQSTKAKNGSSPQAWYLDFKALSTPVAQKLKGLAEMEKQIGEKYDPEDNTELYEIFDCYRKIVRKLSADKNVIFKQLRADINYAERFSLPIEQLTAIKTEFNTLLSAFDAQVRPVSELNDVKAYVAAKNSCNAKVREELMKNAGIDADQTYRAALENYKEGGTDNNQALQLFEKVRGYADSVEYIEKINKYFNFYGELFRFAGRNYVFRSAKTAPVAPLNVQDPAADPTVAEAVAPVSRGSLDLFEVVDGTVSEKPTVHGIDKIITCYGSCLYYFKNTGGIACYNFVTHVESVLDRAPISEYLVDPRDLLGQRGYEMYFNRAENTVLVKKKLPVRMAEEKQGCFAKLFRSANGPEVVKRPNNFTVVAVDMKSGAVNTLLPELVDVADKFGDTLFYTVAEPEMLGEGKKAKKIYKTRLMHCDINTGEKAYLLDESCEIHNVINQKVIYTVWKPNAYNYDLRVYDLATKEDVLIESNVYDYFTAHKDYIYYKVGNESFCPLVRNNLTGTDRKEVMRHCQRVVHKRGNWLYIQKSNGVHSMLVKLSCDGERSVVLCNKFKRFVKIDEDRVYYLDAYNNLHVVRPDGKEDREIAHSLFLDHGNLEASLVIGSDTIYYVRMEQVDDDRRSKSLYSMDLDGRNIRKLVFDIDKMLDYGDGKTIYFSKSESMRYRVTVPAAKKSEESVHYETHTLHKYFSYDTDEHTEKLLLTLGQPHGRTSFKKGCLAKEVKADLTYEEAPVVVKYKRTNMASIGATSAAAENNLRRAQNAPAPAQRTGLRLPAFKMPKMPKVALKTSINPIILLAVLIATVVGVVLAFALPMDHAAGIVVRVIALLGFAAATLTFLGVLPKFIPALKKLPVSRVIAGILAVVTVMLLVTTIVTIVNVVEEANRPGTKFENAITLSENSSQTARFDEKHSTVYFRFTPSTSGTYTFSYSGSGWYSNNGRLYDSNRNSLQYGADSLSYYLQAGSTYYLTVSSSNRSGSCSVRVTSGSSSWW